MQESYCAMLRLVKGDEAHEGGKKWQQYLHTSYVKPHVKMGRLDLEAIVELCRGLPTW